MPVLGHRDLEAVLTAVARVRAVPSSERFPAVALHAVRELVPCSVASFNDIDPVAARFVAVVDPPDYPITEEQNDAFARLAAEHPLIRHFNATGDGSAVALSDFVSRKELHRSALYREVYGPLGIEHQMSITLPGSLPRIVAIALSRSDVDFDERDRRRLDAVRSHLAQAYQVARERDLLRSMLGTLTGALRENETDVIALDGAPQELTPGATELLVRYFGPLGADGALPPRVDRWIRRHAGDAPDELRLLPQLTGRCGASMLLVRLLAGADGQLALMLNERPAPARTDELRLLGLTEREAEVLRLLTEGASDREIVLRLHIAPGTVRKHLDNLYRKLGVRRRAQAVAMALQLLPGDG